MITILNRTSGRPFPRRYTKADIGLLAEVDALHGTLSGPATRQLCIRALIHLSRGKVLRLGPRKEGQISTHDAGGEHRPRNAATAESSTARSPPCCRPSTSTSSPSPAPDAATTTPSSRAWERGRRPGRRPPPTPRPGPTCTAIIPAFRAAGAVTGSRLKSRRPALGVADARPVGRRTGGRGGGGGGGAGWLACRRLPAPVGKRQPPDAAAAPRSNRVAAGRPAIGPPHSGNEAPIPRSTRRLGGARRSRRGVRRGLV